MATNGNDTIVFSGSLQNLSVTLTNAYSGYTISIDEEKNVNDSIYNGLAGNDTLILTPFGDALFILDNNGQQTIQNVETILASAEGDIIDLSSTTIVLNDMTIIGGTGDDILWANAGDDFILGDAGNDILHGGPGNDFMVGGAGDDIVFGGDGDDTMFGNNGNDYYEGGNGADQYHYNNFAQVGPVDTIVETEDGSIDSIVFVGGPGQNVTLADLTFDVTGNDLTITVTDALSGNTSEIFIEGQFDSTSSGIDQIIFENQNLTFDLRSVTQNDDPVAADDSFTGQEDSVLTDNVLANDSDPNSGDVLQVVEQTITTAAGGTVELLANGDFTYTPVADFFGTDSFEYTVTDGNGGSDTANVTLDIADVPEPPIDTNLDIRVSHGNTAQKFINSADGYDIAPTAFGITESVDNQIMGVSGAAANAQVSYSFADTNTAIVTLDTAWNSMKNVEVSSDSAGDITLDNFVHTDVHFGGGSDSNVNITDAKRGFITTGDGGDTITVETLTNNAHWSNVFDIRSGDGNDMIDFTGDKGISEVVIDAGNGSDTAVLQGDYKTSSIDMGAGNDSASGGAGIDTIYGGEGDDTLNGGAGDDILYGGNNDVLIVQDKDFSDDIMFPELQERVNIKKLNPSGEPALGIKDPNLTVDFEATATLTFRKGFAGYNNSLGIYRINEDGGIEAASLLWENVKDAGINVAHQIDIPVGADGGDYGFFIIANGDRTNQGYRDMDTGTEGNIRFVYDYGKAGERDATIHDSGKDITVLYDDGTTQQVLRGHTYHTTERGADAQLNADGKVHAVSGLIDEDNPDVLKIGFEDLKNLGDADFEDVLFEIDVNEVIIDTSEQGNDTLDGGDGKDVLYGEGGDDILVGGQGSDTLYGGTGADKFVFDHLEADHHDTVKDFNADAGDLLDISDILVGFDINSDLDDFIQLIIDQANMDTIISVNADGQGTDFQTVAVIENFTGVNSLDQMVADGLLQVDSAAIV